MDRKEITADEVQVEDGANHDGDRIYGVSRNGWERNIGNPIDSDDDEDNWSRQVETDDVIQRMPSSVTGGETNTIDDDEDGPLTPIIALENAGSPGQQQQSLLIPQPRPQPTMKEKLVERERQRRVESERARWKRQFAMAAHAEAEHDEDDNNNGSHPDANGNDDQISSSVINDHDRSFLTDRNSVAGTVGEDTVAPIDTLEEDNNDPTMNYPMERFLQDHRGARIANNCDGNNQHNGIKNETQGVVMERFLQEQPTTPTGAFMTDPSGSSPSSSVAPLHVDSIRIESSVGQVTDDQIPVLNLPSNGCSANTIENELVGELVGDNAFQSPSQQPRVVLRLTEAEIQEMAAIDDASRSNAPPSERDDISELGELVSDFGTGLTHFDVQNMSQGTPVTAVESIASSLGNQIGQITVLSNSSSDHDDGFEGHSISSNVVPSSAGGDISLTGNPPSEVARDEEDEADGILSPQSPVVPTEILPTEILPKTDVPLPQFASVPIAEGTNSRNDSGDQLQLPVTNEIIVNRTMRPGLYNYKQQGKDYGRSKNLDTPQTVSKSQNEQIPVDIDNHIEDFDFDKNNFVSSPLGDATDNEFWSPGISERNLLPDYGAIAAAEDVNENVETHRFDVGSRTKKKEETMVDDENKPLLGGIPPAVNVTVEDCRRKSPWDTIWSIRKMEDLNSLAEGIFGDIRAESTITRLVTSEEAEDYSGLTMMKRAFPDRMFALTVTLLLEMPTIILISGGSDKLCRLIGLSKYTTLVALLPIVSAISGNVGLQTSSLTTRAITQGQVKMESLTSWLAKEIGAAFYIGLGMGVATGTIAFVMGTFSVPFALSIFAAQFIGILTAACTGIFAPLLLKFIFRRDSGKWNGTLETAVQDVIASFAMIIISYKIMLLFGPYKISPNDICSIPE